MQKYLRHPGSLVLRLLCLLSGMITGGALLLVAGYVLVKGVPYLKPSLFALEYNSENVSMLPALINTVWMTVLALAVAAPLGIGGAIYLVEYAPRNSRLVRLVRVTAETLSGIPSILYGLFGMILFVTALRWRYSVLSGALTLAIMVLPLILRTTEEALLSVPDSYREGSYGLGAGRLRTIFKEGVTSFDVAQNIVVLKTMPGLASAACAAIDGMDIANLVGSLAGDDTAILIMRTNEDAAEFCNEIHSMLK